MTPALGARPVTSTDWDEVTGNGVTSMMLWMKTVPTFWRAVCPRACSGRGWRWSGCRRDGAPRRTPPCPCRGPWGSSASSWPGWPALERKQRRTGQHRNRVYSENKGLSVNTGDTLACFGVERFLTSAVDVALGAHAGGVRPRGVNWTEWTRRPRGRGPRHGTGSCPRGRRVWALAQKKSDGRKGVTGIVSLRERLARRFFRDGGGGDGSADGWVARKRGPGEQNPGEKCGGLCDPLLLLQ